MKIDIRDLQNLLKDVHLHVHIHNDDTDTVVRQVLQLRALKQSLSRSTFKLKLALDRAYPTAPLRAQPSETHDMKTPMDQAIAELTDVITMQDTVLQSAIIYIDATPELIQHAYDAGIANGVKPEQLGALSGLIEHLKANSQNIKDALSANTIPAIPPVVVPVLAEISSIAPTSGFDGTTIVITGTGFGSKGVVTLSGTECPQINYSDTSITVTVPVGASPGPTEVTVDLVVTPDGGAAVSTSFTVTPDPNA